jgi:hypothetical protein
VPGGGRAGDPHRPEGVAGLVVGWAGVGAVGARHAGAGRGPWMDRLLRQAGRADLVQLTPGTIWPVLAVVSGATVGAVLASRRPRHPAGWLLLALALSLTTTAAAAQYLTWGLLVRPGSLPAARSVALYYPATGYAALALIGFLMLLTPTGKLPSPGWRWWARVMAAAPALLVLVATLRTEIFQLDPPTTIVAAQVRDRFHLDPSCTGW